MYDSVWGLKLTVTKRPTSGHFLQFWSTTNWIWPPIWPNNIQSSQLPGHVRQNCRTFCLTNLKKLYRALVSQSKGHFTWFYSTSHKKISASLPPTPTGKKKSDIGSAQKSSTGWPLQITEAAVFWEIGTCRSYLFPSFSIVTFINN